MDTEPTRGHPAVVVALVATLLVGVPAAAESKAGKVASAAREGFRAPDLDCRPMVRWIWPDVAVSMDGIERELTQIRDAGFGGVEIQALAPAVRVSSDGTKESRSSLSPDRLDALAFASAKARKLGLTVDLALGGLSGWGGPHIKRDHAAVRLRTDSAKWAHGAHMLDEATSSVPATAGPALDPFDPEAVALHLRSVGEPLVRAVGDHGRAVVADRQDGVVADWTSDFPAQFKKRRGYDVHGRLYSLTTREADAADLRHDYAVTLGELLDERYFAPLQEWSRAHRLQLRASIGGALPATLSSLRFADLPEGQGLPWNDLDGVRWASSAAHLFGKPASAVIWTEVSGGFGASPLDLKIDADQALLAGATHLVGHAWSYSVADGGSEVSLLDGASAVNPRNPWWPVMSELGLYLRRATLVVRQGEPVTDIAVYVPTHDALSELAPGDVNLGKAIANRMGPDLAPAILAAGFAFDLIDDRTLQSMAEVRSRKLRVGGNAYGIVVLPNVEQLPAATLARFQAFAAAGGTVIATRRLPSRLPGAHQSKPDNERLRAMAERLFDGATSAGKLVRDENGQLGSVLRKALDPDVRTAIVSPHIGFVHRRAADLDVYFLVNTANVPYENAAEFRVTGRTAEWWDTRSGNSSMAQVLASSPTATKVLVSLAAYESKALVFGLVPHDRERTAKSGRKMEAESPSLTMDLSNGWDVTFQGSDLHKHMEWLSSWTESADTRTFSGEAVYRKTVLVKQPQWLTAHRLVLGLGETKPSLDGAAARRTGSRIEAPVRDAAIVFVNGKRAGSTWCPPYEVDVSGFLREGSNLIEIHAYNLASNQLSMRPRRAHHSSDVDAGGPLDPTGMRWAVPSPAGLLGPITLRTAE